VAQHFIQVGTLEESGVRMKINPVQRPIVRKSEQHSTSMSETSIPVSSVVEVSWSHADISKDILKMYLENQKRSGGGKLKDLRFFAEEQKAYVTFIDAESKHFKRVEPSLHFVVSLLSCCVEYFCYIYLMKFVFV